MFSWVVWNFAEEKKSNLWLLLKGKVLFDLHARELHIMQTMEINNKLMSRHGH